ncbi:unnamed protein product [Oikopleura dioica]|uniref:Uncharacterized protein n=1 Tax=Oikopleura dioica TaxID=34765 RepID=E4XJ05_OIKDI|nr:unnamed protein product [Oikopleura dioica]
MAKLKWSVSRYPKSYPLPQLRENINTLKTRGIVIMILAFSMTIIMWFPIPVASSGYSTFALILWILHLTFINLWYITFLSNFAPPQMIPLLFSFKFISFPIYYLNTPLYSTIIAENDEDIDFTISSAILLTIVLASSTVLIYFYVFTKKFMRAKERAFLYFPNHSGWKGERLSIVKKIADIFVSKE